MEDLVGGFYVAMSYPTLNATRRFPNDPQVIAYWQSRGWVLLDDAGAPATPVETQVLTIGLGDARYSRIGSGGGGGSSSASDLTSGTLNPARIGDGTLPPAKLSGRLTETQVPASTALFVVYNATSNTWPARGASTTPKMFVSDLSPNAPQPTDAVAGDMWVAYAPPAT